MVSFFLNWQIKMNVAPVHVKMVEPVLIQSMSTHAAVLQGMLETTVRQVSF